MKHLGLGLALLALVAGLTSALYWYRAGKVFPAETYASTVFGESDVNTALAGVRGLLRDSLDGAKFNKTAAFWTAITVMLGAAANFVNALTCPN